MLVIGDSLVAGTGASTADAWPTRLAQRTGWEVINAGVPGDTSADALRRLEPLLAHHHPDAVIIAVGGNDFLRSVATEETRTNLERLLHLSRSASEHVALVAIPTPSIGSALVGRLSDHPMYAELARQHQVALVPSAVADVLSRPELRADRIHANANGYAALADRVTDALSHAGWLRRP